MKTFILFSLLSIARQAASSPTPWMEYDPDTAKDCVEWHNNLIDEPEPYIGDSSCKAVRDYYGITPEEFHKWNPSVGLDCQPWYDETSYCIVTLERLNDTGKLTTTSSSSTATATTTTTSAFTLGPSPTSWAARGCYVEDPKLHVLEQNMSPAAGDASLTIPKCKNSCYRRAYTFAGLQEGNQCWCGSYVGGEWTSNQTDCNVPCTGDKNSFCGGKGLLNIFEALANEAPPTFDTTSSSSSSSSSTTTSGTVSGATFSSGAMKNMALF
ncbi:hypothetical protein B0H65DRAFT_477881 [Neurospora tetraspora]|uniref:WSC domain-containing protein n=1 Tax=Neurospora tetraspora TaxID=94610 RepID=A0AAE0MMK7_9PEZI|nr:hypothetical protein B0H65DRAFT_477881 [Neurospora tetraspora]